MGMMRNITAGSPKALWKPIAYTVLSNLVAIIPFVLLVEVAKIIFTSFADPAASLDITRLWWICTSMAGAMVLLFISEIPAYRAQYRGAYTTAVEGRSRLAEHLRKLSLGYLNKRDPGDLANMMMGDFALVEHGISHVAPQLFAAALTPILALLGLSLLDWRLALALFATLPFTILIVLATSSLTRKLGANHMRAKINASNRLQEYLNGIQVIKAFNLTGDRFVRLEQSFKDLMQHSIRIEGILGPVVLSAVALLRAGLTLMAIIGVHLLLGGSLDLITFVTFLLIGTRIYDPLTTALTSYAEFRYNEQAGKRIIELLGEPVMSGEKQPPAGHDLVFDNVTFGYNEHAVIQQASLSLPSGSFTALVGPSGSGKSTVLRLIARFYDPSEGQVLLSGENIREMNPEALLRKVSMVFQDVYLFQDTIANNIRVGKAGATQHEVEQAARQACCHDFIMKLPLGYETLVGESGSTLSGGEKQRISIARAILKDAPIVLLDEATASLDPENEADIQQAIDRLIQGRTVIAIAHRLKTVMNADQIIVLDQGRIVEQGQHEELLVADRLYARLWKLQQQTAGWQISS